MTFHPENPIWPRSVADRGRDANAVYTKDGERVSDIDEPMECPRCGEPLRNRVPPCRACGWPRRPWWSMGYRFVCSLGILALVCGGCCLLPGVAVALSVVGQAEDSPWDPEAVRWLYGGFIVAALGIAGIVYAYFLRNRRR